MDMVRVTIDVSVDWPASDLGLDQTLRDVVYSEIAEMVSNPARNIGSIRMHLIREKS